MMISPAADSTAKPVAPARVVIKTIADARSYLDSRGHAPTFDGDFVVESAACGRCGGSGIWSNYHGECFQCRGANTLNSVTHTPIVAYARNARKQEMAHARQGRARAKRQSATAARQHEGQRNWCEKNGHGRITFDELDAKRDAERVATIAAEVATLAHVGTVGKRGEMVLTLVKVIVWEGTYGPTFLHLCEDGDGNKINYKTGSRLWCRSLDVDAGPDEEAPMPEGTTFACRATVKSHDMYSRSGTDDPEIPQTTVQRVSKVVVP